MGTKDMSMKDLKLELERQGRVPAPPPRRQFVEELLTRIQVEADDDLEIVDAEPIALADRRAVTRLRALGALAAAAVLLVVLGLYTELRGNDDASQVVMAAEATPGQKFELQVRPDGTTDGPDGRFSAKCRAPASFEYDGSKFTCQAGDQLTLTVKAGKVVAVQPGLTPIPVAEADEEPTNDSPANASTLPAPQPSGTGAPSSRSDNPSANPGPTTTPSTIAVPGSPGGPPTVGPSTTPTMPPLVPAPGASSDPGTAVPVVPSFELTHRKVNGSAEITWKAWDQAGRYTVVRTTSSNPAQDPDTPLVPQAIDGTEAVVVEPVNLPSFVQPLDGSAGVPIDTAYVSFRVGVYDVNGKLIGLSNTLKLKLSWSFKPSEEDVPPASSTTTTTATSTSTTVVSGSPAEGAIVRSRS